MNQDVLKSLECDQRHFVGCAVVAFCLMIFMWVGSNMEYAHDSRSSMHIVAMLSGIFVCVFIAVARNIGKNIAYERHEAMAQPIRDWYDGK